METKANYVLIGAFTILVAVFLLLFGLWAAKYSSDKSWHRFRVVFSEAVTGLSEGSSVQYNGISVGTVEKLNLMPDDPRKVQALLKLQSNTPVRIDTKAKLSQQGLTGSPFIQLTGGTPSAPLLEPTDRNDIPLIQAEPSAFQNIADTANKLVERLDAMVSEENVQRITATLTNLERATGAIGDQEADIRALIANARLASEDLRTTLQTTNGAVARIDREVVARLPALIGKLDHAIGSIESASGNANSLIAENRGPIKSFTRDGLQQLGPTLQELRLLMRDLRRVSNRLDGNPAGYILGRQPQPKEFEPK